MSSSGSRPTVADAMIGRPKLCRAGTTVEQAAQHLRNDHVHALLIVDGSRLLAVVERADLVAAQPDAPAQHLGRLDGRVVGPGDDLATVARAMTARQRRRLAVVDGDGRLVGLLCHKRARRRPPVDMSAGPHDRLRRPLSSTERLAFNDLAAQLGPDPVPVRRRPRPAMVALTATIGMVAVVGCARSVAHSPSRPPC